MASKSGAETAIMEKDVRTDIGVRQLGGKSLGTLEEFARHSSINEHPGQYPDAQTMISNLLKDHETIIKTLRKNADEAEEQYEDMATNDFFLEAV